MQTNKETKKEKQVKSTTIEASIIIVFRLLERFIEMTNKDIFVKTILLWQLMDIKQIKRVCIKANISNLVRKTPFWNK